MLDAFDIPAVARERRPRAGVVERRDAPPDHAAGIGTEQAFLLYVLNGVAAASVLLAFSVGAKLTLTLTNVVAGFTAIALTLRTVRYKKALDLPKEDKPAKPRASSRRTPRSPLALAESPYDGPALCSCA